jgi:hypothetical protein
MDAYVDAFTAASRLVTVEIYTHAYHVAGTLTTRFSRVAEMLNQLSGSHVSLEKATIAEYAAPTGTLAAPQAYVALDEILFMVALDTEGAPRAEMLIHKRPVRAQLAIPPFRLTGLIHVVHGTRPVDALLNLSDRFMPMTNVTVTSGPYPDQGRDVAAVALRRDRAHVLMVADDERPDDLLAEVIDERTAEAWLHAAEEGRSSEGS